MTTARSARPLAARAPAPLPRAAIALGFAGGFINMAHRGGFGVLYPAIVADQGWSVGEVTGAYSVAMLLFAATVVLTGQLVDRLGVRATMLAGTACLGAGLATLGLARELWQFYLLYALAAGLGSSATGFVPMLKLASLRAGSRIGTAVGLFSVGQGVGALVTSPLLQLIVDGAGWRPGFVALGVLSLALLPLALLGAPGRAESRGQKASRPVGARVWREPLFWLVFAANVGLGYLQLLPTHQVAHLTLVGLPSLLAATAGGLMGACIGIGALLGGWWVDRWGPGRFGPIGAALFCLGVLGLLGSGPAALGLTAAYVLAGGLGRGTLGVVTAVVQARAFAGPSLGRVSGMFDVGFGLGSFAGPYLTALGRDLSGSYAPGLATCIPAALLVTATTAWARAIQAGQESPAPDLAGRPAG